MGDVLTGRVKRFSDLDELSASLATYIVDLINSTVKEKNRFTMAVSGGSTPQLLYELLATKHFGSVKWEVVEIFFCDERYVPYGDKQSNYKMVKEKLLDHVPIPKKNIHSISTSHLDPVESARLYDEEIKSYFGADGSAFDLALLGIGKEGHTASLFPGSPALNEKEGYAVAVQVPAIPRTRITLTYPALNRAAEVCFLISGKDKAKVLKDILQGTVDFHSLPASGVKPQSGRLIWCVDRAAFTED